MEDFANLLHRDYGLKPQGKMAPMSATKSGETATAIKGKSSNNNINSHHSTSSRSGRASFPGDENDLFFGTSNNKSSSSSSSASSASARNANAYDDVFGGPPKFAPPKPSSATSSSIPLYDDIFRTQPPPPPAVPTSKDHSLPVFDTPYEDDIFLGVRGTRSSGVAYDNVFGGGASSSGSPSEDLLGGYRSGSSQKTKVSPPAPSYDDEELLPGLGSGYTSSKPAAASSSTFIPVDDNAPAHPAEVDPFAGIQSVPYSGMPSIADPLDPFMETAPKSSSSNGAEVDGLDGFDIFSQPNNHVKTSSSSQRYPRASKDSTASDTEVKSVRQNFAAASKPTVMEPESDVSPPKSTHEDDSPGNSFGSPDFNDVTDQESWITVDKVRLVTEPTVAPPPSRPAPGFAYEQRTAVKQDSDEESPNEDANDAATKEAYEKAEAKLKLEKEREIQRKEQERLEREREEREKERHAQRKAVERATQEARERAANAARERIAVERATNEARERAAAEARQKAEKERAERAAAERAAAERAVSESRARAQRAALEKLNADRAAQRAAAEAAANATQQQQQQQNRRPDDLDSFFNPRANSAPKQRPPTSDSSRSFGSSNDRKAPTSTPVKKASSVSNMDELTNLFDPPTANFKEIDGETEDRRKARFDRDQRTQARARQALEEKHRRDLAAQREQAEKQRASESLDAEIKRWAAGKEGNIRALLSTLQYVLWPECGWQPVSLTDLITGASVKKVYRKATLCVHPDKVQQKGATVQQKYIAEKVFDLLKESWNKFNSEELF